MILFLRTDGIIVCTDVRLHIYGTHTGRDGTDGRTDSSLIFWLLTHPYLIKYFLLILVSPTTPVFYWLHRTTSGPSISACRSWAVDCCALMAPMFSMVWGLRGAFSRRAMGFFHGRKNLPPKKKLASPKILRGNT